MTPIIDDLTERVDAELVEIVGSRDMPLYKMMSYHMGWDDQEKGSGAGIHKDRVHGVLCLLACAAAGGDLDSAIPAAAAVELVDNFCQIHDDVQMGNPKRDNRDAVWWVWGPAQAINAGDGMHALARLALFRLLERGVSSSTTFRAGQTLDDASLKTCEGRFLELEAQERIDLSVDAYLKMATLKSGSLSSCAMRLGTAVVSDDEAVAEAVGVCGEKLGVAMQVNSDLRALWESEEDAPSPHVMNKTKLLPVVYALEKASLSEKRALGEIYFKRVLEPDDVRKVRDLIEGIGAREDCEKLVETYRVEAVAALEVEGISAQGREEIESYASSMLR